MHSCQPVFFYHTKSPNIRMNKVDSQMPRWIDDPLSTNLAILLHKSIVSFCLLPNVVELDYFFHRPCGDLVKKIALKINFSTIITAKLNTIIAGNFKFLLKLQWQFRILSSNLVIQLYYIYTVVNFSSDTPFVEC